MYIEKMNFRYYVCNNNFCFSLMDLDLERIEEDRAQGAKHLYFLGSMKVLKSRKCFAVTSEDDFLLTQENEELLSLKKNMANVSVPNWIKEKIKERKIRFINILYPSWQDALSMSELKKKDNTVHIVGAGDVGGTLLIGLRLLAQRTISTIGIYGGGNKAAEQRWEYEGNQTMPPEGDLSLPKIKIISEEELFNCDLFAFCASVGVPPLGEEVKDVRLAQYKGNSGLIGYYAKLAREREFKGMFAVVSDPVDLLCRHALMVSNTGENGEIDLLGLSPEQIRGYGLGVMYARAVYYATKDGNGDIFIDKGRVYGPHGNGLIVANSLEQYDDEYSNKLTERTIRANIEVRGTGFKPYIAPAMSSGAYSILAALKGEWHYSAISIGGIFMGTRNRLTFSGTELERNYIPEELMNRIRNTYSDLEAFK